LSLKGANSPTRGRKLRSSGTKPTARVSNGPNSLVELKKQLEERTRELAEARGHLSEALEQQTATAEVLQVISSSPRELDPVFKTMMENATRLCEAESASLGLCEGADVRIVARYNAPAALLEQTKREPLFRPGPTSGVGRSIRLKQVVQVPDLVNDQMYFDREPARVRVVEAGYRSQLSVPLIKHDEAIGARTARATHTSSRPSISEAFVQSYSCRCSRTTL
jgi:GAF domain-containing protein